MDSTPAATGRTKRRAVAELSLEYKLPLIMCGLLMAAIIALSAAAYFQMRQTSLQGAGTRLTGVSGEMRDLLAQSGTQLRAQIGARARKPDLALFEKSRSAANQALATAALRPTQQPDQVPRTELRDGKGAVLLAVGTEVGLDSVPATDVIAAASTIDSAAIGQLRVFSDTIVYPIAARVVGANDLFVVEWRRIAGSRRSRDQLTKLIGSDASLMVGNLTGNQWTDLERPVVGPPPSVNALEAPTTYTRPSGGLYLISAAAIPGTPWQVAVDFPMAGILAPINTFMQRIVLIALIALAVGLLIVRRVSRRITDPLLQLTHAADKVAGGDYAEIVQIDRSDELGRLGRAFGTMTTEIRTARAGLEHKVDERTRDLNTTLAQLRDAQDTLVRREKLAILGQLAGGVGHELRNPLGVMTNAVYYLKVVLAESPQNVKEYLEILQQQINLSEKIVGDLLDFARLKPPQRAATTIDQITQAQLARVGHTNGVRISAEGLTGLPEVYVDEVQIGQIVLNLLTNAVQAIDGTGVVTMRGRSVAGTIQFEVSDTGPGVPAENIEKVFEPLFTTKARGIGLGLAVSRSLARANDGDLTVLPATGLGATFVLTLPVRAVA